jgi:DNA polymerase-3 subunit epsilon/ATP-dependent DNA helicase DinG
VGRAQVVLAPCFEALAAHLRRGGEDDRLLLDRSLRAQPGWTAVELAWAALDRALRDVASRAGAAVKAVADGALSEEPDTLAGEIETAARKVDELRALLEQLMNTTDDSTITWLGREREGTTSVNSAPLDVGPRLWEELFSKRRTVIATSATLSAAGSMDYAASRMGLESPRTLQLGSPYDYEASTLLAAVTDVPEPSSRDFNDASAAAIVKLVRASEGRALALFTSHAALRRVASLVREELEGEGINVLAQGVDGEPRRLTEHLASSPRTLVLGTQSFWEGVDIRGDALSMLIIVKLPFPVPSDPVHRARSEQYDSPFGQYSLPSAILKFRQGFGRLIRDREDRGVVAVLDRRVFEKSYGKQFVSALPPCTRIRASAQVVGERTREWLDEG